jgi:hypothetical protein
LIFSVCSLFLYVVSNTICLKISLPLNYKMFNY